MDNNQQLRVAGFLPNSTVNGPNIRSVIFLAGCNHACVGCQNAVVQDYNSGVAVSIQQLLEDVKENKSFIEGVTFSGGEPMDQDFSALALAIKKEGLSIWVYTGYTINSLLQDERPHVKKNLKYVDVLVDGKFEIDKVEDAPRYAGSSNQRFVYLKEGEIVDIKNRYEN